MNQSQPYSTQKMIHHPEMLQALRDGKSQYPTQIHFMPALSCNQACQFCSYGHRVEGDGEEQQNWKNMVLMSDEYMPVEKMRECIYNWWDMGVKAIELTGGGEPLIYPHVDEFFQRVAEWGVDLALVTNGTALTEARAKLFEATNWKWARVSIDAGSWGTYVATRRVPMLHWDLAWKAVDRLAGLRKEKEQRVGVGYVVDHSNFDGIYEACRLAVFHGADNVRVALAFTPQALSRFPPGAVAEAIRQTRKAKDDFSGKLQVNDLVSERLANIEAQTQNYQFCAVKEVLCVVGGDQQVYTCCTLAFNPKGLIGSIKDQSFETMWNKATEEGFFSGHDASKICNMPCLYEKRNLRALELIKMSPKEVTEIAAKDQSIHRNFI